MSIVAPETARQERLYIDVVNIYEPVELEVGADKRLGPYPAGLVESTPSREGQLGKYYPSSEYNAASPVMGRTLQDNMLTLDRFHFPAGVELKDGTVLEIDTPDHPDQGAFFRVQGNSETWVGSSVRQSKYSRVFCKRIPPPAEITAGTIPASATREQPDVYDVLAGLTVLGVFDVVAVE